MPACEWRFLRFRYLRTSKYAPFRLSKTTILGSACPESQQAEVAARCADFPQLPSFIDKPQ
jgi:hypothetical protein